MYFRNGSTFLPDHIFVCGVGHHMADVSRSHIIRYTHPVGLLWTRDQLVAGAATYKTHNKHKRPTPMHALNGMRTRNPSNQAAVDLRLGPHGHRYRISQSMWCLIPFRVGPPL